jgi:ethanolamine ammonia-lyase large subunit
MYRIQAGGTAYAFSSLKELLAKATPLRSGDVLAGAAATSAEENVVAKMALADVPLKQFLNEAAVPTRTTMSRASSSIPTMRAAFAPVAQLTVAEFRDWLLSEKATPANVSRWRQV